jgi:hypothetical protein
MLPGAMPELEPEPEHEPGRELVSLRATESLPGLPSEAAEQVRRLSWLLHKGETKEIIALFTESCVEKLQLQEDRYQLKKRVAALEAAPLTRSVGLVAAEAEEDRASGDGGTVDGSGIITRMLGEDLVQRRRQARVAEMTVEFEKQRIQDEKYANWFVVTSLVLSSFTSWLMTEEPSAGGNYWR